MQTVFLQEQVIVVIDSYCYKIPFSWELIRLAWPEKQGLNYVLQGFTYMQQFATEGKMEWRHKVD